MSSGSIQMLRVSRGKRFLLQASAVALVVLGALPSPFVSFSLHSVLPFLGGLYLAFAAYGLLRKSSSFLEIGTDGIVLGSRGRRTFIPWCDISGFSQGSGINRHEVAMSLVSDPLPRSFRLGGLQFGYQRIRYLPDTFGMRAEELAALLNRPKNEHGGSIGHSTEVDNEST